MMVNRMIRNDSVLRSDASDVDLAEGDQAQDDQHPPGDFTHPEYHDCSFRRCAAQPRPRQETVDPVLLAARLAPRLVLQIEEVFLRRGP